MDKPSREESLSRTQDYLETLYREFETEIENITLDIHIHKALREQYETTPPRGLRKRLQLWRRKSYALHRRRARLKSMKDCLSRQIHDLQAARDNLNAGADIGPACQVLAKRGLFSPLDLGV